MGINYSPKIVTDGLVLCLDAGNPLSYPGSGNVWTDLSGNGNNGTLINGPTFTNTNRGSIVLDGVNDSISIPAYSSSILQQGSIETWIYFTNATALASQNVQIYLIPTEQPSGAFHRLFFYRNSFWTANRLSNFLYFKKMSDGTVGAVIPTSIIYNVNTWYQNIFTWSINGTQRIYQNGVLEHSITHSDFDSWYAPTGAGFTLGAFNAHTEGNISIFKIYTSVLSEKAVLQNYNATKGRFGL